MRKIVLILTIAVIAVSCSKSMPYNGVEKKEQLPAKPLKAGLVPANGI